MVVFLTSFGHAQAISLSETVEAALVRWPDQQLTGAERDLAAALHRKAKQPLAADPTFNLKYQTDAIGSDLGYREWEGGVDLPLWWPGQARDHRREADYTLAVADAMARTQRLAVAGEVRQRLWTLVLARSELEQAESARQTALDLADDVKRRVAAGELPRSDLLLAEADVAAREDAVDQAQTRVAQAELSYMQLTGSDRTPPALPESPAPGVELSPHHPDLLLAEAEVERARARRDRISGARRGEPTLWVGAKSTRSETRADYDSAIGIELSLPLGSAAHHAPALAEAEAAFTAVVVARERLHRELQEEVELARMEHRRATAAQQAAQRRHALALASHKISRRAFELGETDLVRLLQVQADAIDAQHDLQLRTHEVGRAVARLNQALGVYPAPHELTATAAAQLGASNGLPGELPR